MTPALKIIINNDVAAMAAPGLLVAAPGCPCSLCDCSGCSWLPLAPLWLLLAALWLLAAPVCWVAALWLLWLLCGCACLLCDRSGYSVAAMWQYTMKLEPNTCT